MMIVKFRTLRKLLANPLTESEMQVMKHLASDPRDMQQIRHQYYNDLLWEYVRNAEEECVINLRQVTSYILTLGTIEEVRGKGIASEILRQVKEEVRRKQFKILMLHVATYNDTAIQAYRKNGFQVVSYCENFYEICEEPFHAYLAVWISDVPCAVFDQAIDNAASWVYQIEYDDHARHPPWHSLPPWQRNS
eukprot:Gregarina_sp_Poly_1__3094@NODE_1870_length_3159_cov_41_316624_g390_i1_p1_GENE_NODE_1870_length_3159_cov_41_316624_g390_i1NODE_1870_length_3159_cov_41_316624_g390_i1_p1_ORF_typecomplete_len192_score18_10Acetyltransf_1/PF00583_25/1_5e10FR47/PF08445_10/8_6e10Acetyltransf_10/PF13673_7/1_1e09Acetyltransf_7/PF13508_7/1_4e07Acetyltransf_4/PF13420_7/4_8e07Acetyltransf_9/PF13527_7/0_00011Gly_acyl_tr_C/PF08444_10/1_4e03Gly_acyl_tr_C/PF08444_10/0_00037Acetyltransf_3/PF13302_7/0_00045Acetyltransf_15/PF17013